MPGIQKDLYSQASQHIYVQSAQGYYFEDHCAFTPNLCVTVLCLSISLLKVCWLVVRTMSQNSYNDISICTNLSQFDFYHGFLFYRSPLFDLIIRIEHTKPWNFWWTLAMLHRIHCKRPGWRRAWPSVGPSADPGGVPRRRGRLGVNRPQCRSCQWKTTDRLGWVKSGKIWENPWE